MEYFIVTATVVQKDGRWGWGALHFFIVLLDDLNEKFNLKVQSAQDSAWHRVSSQ